MGGTEVSKTSLLIVSDSTVDAALVKSLLDDGFEHVAVSVNADSAVEDFRRHRPDVLLLDFKDLEKSEQFYLGLFRLGAQTETPTHRAIILCTQQQIRQAYALCHRGLFDDYVVFWPWTHDVSRLPMSIHRAIRELAALPDATASLATVHAPVDPLTALDTATSQIGGMNESLRRAAHSGDVEGAGAQQMRSNAHQRTILVVDDDNLQRKLAGRILKSQGFAVQYAASGGEALDLLAVARIDLILMDFLMPDMNGLEIIQRLSAEPRLTGIPAIMITGNSERQLVLTSLKVGAVDFIVKPWDRSTLLAKIGRVLDIRPKVSDTA
jgi:CheY-like chemotaxis protein